MRDEIRVKIDEKEQKRIFINFIKDFNRDFSKASNYLGISNSSLSKYKRCTVRYIPKNILIKIIDYLRIEKPKIVERGTLKEIRRKYINKAQPILEKKYGKNWAKELTKRRDFKGISLEDFPHNTFIYLKDNYRKRLLKLAYNLAGNSSKLAKIIRVSPSRLTFWYKGEQKDYKRNKVGLQFIPLSKLRFISRLLVEDHNYEFSMKDIEKNTIMYRMQAGNPIKNPKFPIKESPEIIRLLFHLLGDGYSGIKGESANYRNTCTELLYEFEQDLKIFGDVPVYKQQYSIKFPRIIAEIIENFYKVNTKTFDSRISKIILKIPKKLLCQGLRAFVDDEGSVYKSSIRLTSANYNLLEGIKQILDYLKIRRNEIRKMYPRKIYYLDILDSELYKDKINFTHPKKKEKLGEYIRKKKIKRRKRLLKLKP